jgi:hypothetical protein
MLENEAVEGVMVETCKSDQMQRNSSIFDG